MMFTVTHIIKKKKSVETTLIQKHIGTCTLPIKIFV